MDILDTSETQARDALIFCSSRKDGDYIADMLHKGGCKSKVVTDARNARKEAKTLKYDVIFSVVNGLNCYGMELLKWLQDTVYGINRVCITMKESTSLLNEVYKLGVNGCFYYHAIERDILAECMNSMFKSEDSFIWYERRSPAFKECGDRILAEGKSRRNLLITGEHGSGKCSIARLIHNHGELRNGKFIVADCSTFFNEREAHDRIVGSACLEKTAIYRSQQGLLCQSNGGTLLVDHVEKLPYNLQEMFVSVIEDGKYYDLATKQYLSYTGRLIFTAPDTLQEMVMDGTFSPRLYHAMRQSYMRVPSLCECSNDISPLAEAFIRDICTERNRPIPELTKGAQDALQKHLWTGNVRELYSVISNACAIFHGNTIGEHDLDLLEPIENGYQHSDEYKLKKALRSTNGNVSAAARLMRKDRTTVTRQMNKYNIRRKDFVKA